MASLPVGRQVRLAPEIIAAAARGWRLLPIRAREKTPLVKGWTNASTSDLSQLEEWAGRYPASNWAVATGQGSGIFVLDIDGKDGKTSLREYQKKGWELPETLTVSTGRGRHIYFSWPDGLNIQNSAGKLAAGLDIRGNGGCAVIPPSIHPNGARYAYIQLDVPIADAPEWLLTLLTKPTPVLVTEHLEMVIPDGKRNSTLASLAGSMRKRGMSQTAIEAALLAENKQSAIPPLPDSEVRGIAASMARYTPGPSVVETLRRPHLVRLSDVEAKPVSWLWEPYLPFGMPSMLSGDPGGGKTFLALAIAASISNGRVPFTNEECRPESTVYLSMENSPEHVIKPRFDLLRGDADRFHLLQGSVSLNDGSQQHSGITLKDTELLRDALVETKAGLLIVDPIQSYLGADVDFHRSNETRPVLDGLARLAREHNCCILLVRHLAKASGGRAIHRGLGSIDLTGAVRTELMVGNAADDPNSRAMVQVKSNLGRFGDSLGFSIGENSFEWTGKSSLTTSDLVAPDNDSETRSEIAGAVEYLRQELANGPKRQKELVAGSGFTERTLQRAAKRIRVKRERDGERGHVLWCLA